MASKIRTFVAVEVSPEVKSAAEREIERLSRIASNYRWASPETMHVTLNFLGDVHESEIPQVCQVVKRAAESVSSFNLSFRGLNAFPRSEKPRTLWMGMEEGVEAIVALQSTVEEALSALGFPPERNDYRPHLTLGRIQRGTPYSPSVTEHLLAHANSGYGESLVDEVLVFSSYLDRSGPSHTPMSRIELD